jgi:hypothetical protein
MAKCIKHISTTSLQGFVQRRKKVKHNSSNNLLMQKQAKTVTNVYTDLEVMDFILQGMGPTKEGIYRMAIQLYTLDRKRGTTLTFDNVKEHFFELNEQLARVKQLMRMASTLAVGSDQQQSDGASRMHRQQHVCAGYRCNSTPFYSWWSRT